MWLCNRWALQIHGRLNRGKDGAVCLQSVPDGLQCHCIWVSGFFGLNRQQQEAAGSSKDAGSFMNIKWRSMTHLKSWAVETQLNKSATSQQEDMTDWLNMTYCNPAHSHVLFFSSSSGKTCQCVGHAGGCAASSSTSSCSYFCSSSRHLPSSSTPWTSSTSPSQ